MEQMKDTTLLNYQGWITAVLAKTNLFLKDYTINITMLTPCTNTTFKHLNLQPNVTNLQPPASLTKSVLQYLKRTILQNEHKITAVDMFKAFEIE